MKKEQVQWCREMNCSATGGRELEGLMVNLSSWPALKKGWQMMSGVYSRLSGLERVKMVDNVLHKCLLAQQNAEFLKYSPLEAGLFQP